MNSGTVNLIARSSPVTLAVRAAVGLTLSTVAVPHVHAQAAGNLLEDVVVTATRRSSSVQDIPFNITAISDEQFEILELNNIRDISDWVPGLTVLDQGSRDGTPIVVRGLNTNSFDEPRGPGGTVGTYIGEIPVYIDLNLNDIERVEALIGPQGTLYGSGTLGGAIRYIPKAVDLQSFEATVRAGVTQNTESDSVGWETGLVWNQPLLDGRLGIRASYNTEEIPGFVDYNYVLRSPGTSNPQPDFDDPADVAANLRFAEDADGSRIDSGRVAIRFNSSDAFDATLSYFYQKQASEGQTLVHYYPDVADSTVFQTRRYEDGFRYEEPLTRRDQLVSLEVTSNLGFAELVAAGGFSESKRLGQRDQTDLLLALELGYEAFPDFSAFTRDEVNRENTTAEIRLVSLHGGPLTWIGGLFYNESTLDQDVREFVPGFPAFIGVNRPDELELIQTRDGETTEKALYGELSYQFTDKWQATVGARYYEYDSDLTVLTGFPLFLTSIGLIGPDEIPLRGPTNESSDSGSLFKFNTSYTFSDRLMIYYTLSEGYRVGGINPVPPCDDPPVTACGLPDEISILPDTTLNNELGIRSQFLDGRMALNAAVFHIDWDDIQIADRTENGSLRITSNGGTAESKGFELSLAGQLSEHWRLMAAYAYTDAELTSFAPGVIQGSDGFAGDRLAATPRTSASGSLMYITPLSNSLDLSVNYDFVYTGDIYTTVGLRRDGEKLSDYTVHGLSARLAGEKWAATLYVTNLLNEYAVTGVRQNTSFLRDVNGLDLRTYGRWINAPRTIGAGFTYRFD